MGNTSSCCQNENNDQKEKQRTEDCCDTSSKNGCCGKNGCFGKHGCLSCLGKKGCFAGKHGNLNCFSKYGTCGNPEKGCCGSRPGCCGVKCYGLYGCTDCCQENTFDYENNYGFCLISLKKTEYKPGDTIQGSLFIKLYSDFPADQIKLNFAGYEEILFFEGYDKFAKKELNLDNLYLLKKFKKKVSRGDYKIDFQIRIPNDLKNSYSYKYKKDGKNCYSKNKYFLLGGIIKDNEIEHSLLSNKIEIFINDEKENHLNLKEIVSQKGTCCSTIAVIKGNLDYNNPREKFFYANNDNEFVLSLDSSKSKKDFEVQIILKSCKEIINTEKDIISNYNWDIFRKNLGILKAKDQKDFKFIIPSQTIDKSISTTNSKFFKHNFYFQVELINRTVSKNLILKFPLYIKNSKSNLFKFDEKDEFKYFTGDKQVFEKNFYPDIDKCIDLNQHNLEKEVCFFKKFRKNKFKDINISNGKNDGNNNNNEDKHHKDQ